MAFVHLYTADQQQAAIDAMAVREGAQPGDMPPSLGFFSGRRREQVRQDWAGQTLEDRVSALAVMIGGYVPATADSARHIVTHGYEALCRTGRLSA